MKKNGWYLFISLAKNFGEFATAIFTPMTIFKDLFLPFFIQDHKPLVRFAFANIVQLAI
jgi:hypothetical protein